MPEKQLVITEAGNAVMLQLGVWTDNDGLRDHGKPTAILNSATDADLGKAVRKALTTRIRGPRKKAEAAG